VLVVIEYPGKWKKPRGNPLTSACDGVDAVMPSHSQLMLHKNQFVKNGGNIIGDMTELSSIEM
jgi:hypothetical protein